MPKKGTAPNQDANLDQGQEGLSEDELTKSLNMLEQHARSSDDEKQALLQKAMDGDITAEENDRLSVLLTGRNTEPSMPEEIVKSLKPESDERLQKSVDVSEYLDAQHEGLVKAFEDFAGVVQKMDDHQNSFNIVLAKSLRAIGTLAKSMNERLEVIEQQPASQPRAARSVPEAQQLQKGFVGQDPAEKKLSKSEVLSTLEAMNIDAHQKGRNGMAFCGEDLTKSIAKYESTTHISRNLLEELKSFRQRAAN